VGDDQLTLTLLTVLDVVTVRGGSGLYAQSIEMLLEYALYPYEFLDSTLNWYMTPAINSTTVYNGLAIFEANTE
jgi:hypothetical protein